MEDIIICLGDFLKNNYPDLNLKLDIRRNKDKSKGDFYSTIVFSLIPYVNKTPYEIGLIIKADIKDKLRNYNINVANTGYINFSLRKDGYIEILKKIKELDTKEKSNKCFYMDDIDIEKIKYVYYRINTILDVLKMDNIYVNIEKFDKANIELDEKNILDKLLEIFNSLDNDRNENIQIQLISLYNLLYKYEEKFIIKYLPDKRLDSLIVILESIAILLRHTVQNI